jgi:probable HAF family extracellular repeat protein
MKRKRMLLPLLGAGILVAVLLVALLRSKPTALYEATLLPMLGGTPVVPHAINDRGQVVGAAEVTPGQWHLVLWDKDKGLQDLGSWSRHPGSLRLGINNAGQIAGTVVDANGVGRAFVQDPNGTRRLLVDPAGRESVVAALNNRGEVAGYYETGAKPRHACIWDQMGRMTDLGTLGGIESLAFSINDRGQVAGVSGVRAAAWQAFLWDPNTGMIGLGPDPLRTATSCYLNNKGQVAGGFGSAKDQWAISAWTSNTGLQRLNAPGSTYPEVAGLNDTGQILVNTGRSGFRAFGRVFFAKRASYLYDPNGGCVALESHLAGPKGVVYFIAADINNQGQIVGTLFIEGVGWSGAILEPIPERARE